MTQSNATGRHRQIFLPANNRRDDLRATHRDDNPLPVVPDSQRTAEALVMRAPRQLGVGPLETLRRHLDAESRRAEARLRELERTP